MRSHTLARGFAAASLAATLCLGGTVAAVAAPAPASAQASLQAPKTSVDLKALAQAYADRHGIELTVIDPNTPCDQDTVFGQWQDRLLSQMTRADINFLIATQAYNLPAMEADYTYDESNPDFALGPHAQVLTKEFKKLKNFWDIDSSQIHLMAMHGSMLMDRDRVYNTYIAMGVPADQAAALADYVVAYLKQPGALQGGNNPFFTLNAFADTDFGTVPDWDPRIVMGDGILQAYDEMGYGDVAPQVILAHEYGHQVQFAIGMITPNQANSPETTRRTELHADASSSYFVTHPKGMSMQYKRVQQVLAVDYSIGDCYFTSDGHHGTPAQRQAAGQFGYQLQEAARPKSYVLPARTFRDLFDAALPGIIASA